MAPKTILRWTGVVLLVAGTAWFGTDALGGAQPEITEVTEVEQIGRGEALTRARLTGDLRALDAFVAEQRSRAEQPGSSAEEWRILAEAHLERCLLRDNSLGMAVGRSAHSELPAPNVADIEAGLAAADRAVELGDPTADVHRIRSGLLSLRITGFASALSNRPAINAALKSAEAIDPTHPRVVIARACEKLFAPNRLLGQDPAAAERMFVLAADALPSDERPLTFASMCAFLLDRRDDAVALLEKSAARNPNNHYVREVLRRLRAGEDDPFGRDVR